MLFDLTPEIILDNQNKKKYLCARIALYILALIFAIFAIFTIVFPTRYFSFSFLNPNSRSNLIISPRDEENKIPERGKITKDKKFFFDASLLGNFSKAKIIFRLNKKSAEINTEKISIQKSYRAFLYPEDPLPLGFKDGSLLKNSENYFIVSEGKLKKFKDRNILSALGFPQNFFIEVSVDELGYNLPEEIISDTKNYPANSLFKINNEFYILSNNKLTKFISEKAFLSQYTSEQAIEKNSSFFQTYPLNEKQIGFADGSLVAYGESAFVVSENKSFPIDSIETFEAMGYSWEDLINIGGDEMSFYTKSDLLTLFGAHPNGTTFSASDENGIIKKYLAKNGKKYFLPSEKIAESWSKNKPITVSQKSLDISTNCDFGKKWLFSKTYSCKASIENLQNFLGKDYEFQTIFSDDIKVDSLEVRFEKSYTLANFQRFIANVLKNIKNTYVGQE